MKLEERTVASFVTENYKTADIFKKYHIDFCCGGGVSLNNICETKQLDLNKIVNELENIMKIDQVDTVDYDSWELDKLANHILDKHHTYIREASPTLNPYLLKLRKVHGENHPELIKIQELFFKLSSDLDNHLLKEENILFPYILKLYKASLEKDSNKGEFFGTIKNPITCMKSEHDTAGDEIKEIRFLTNNYTVPADGCNTYRVAFKKLEEFEADLFTHIHLENNILFPKAIELESKLTK